MTDRNVALIVLDSVRKDVFDSYATELQKRAGITYDQCRVASTWSVPSHASMLTGELPHEHQVHEYSRSYNTVEMEDTFLDEFDSHHRLGISANVFAGDSFGFDEFFDEFYPVVDDRFFHEGMDVAAVSQELEGEGESDKVDFLKHALAHDHPLKSLGNLAFVQTERVFRRLPIETPFDVSARALNRRARKVIPDTPEPFFLFMNYMDAHSPMMPRSGYNSALYNVSPSWSSDEFDWRTIVEDGNQERIDEYRSLYEASVDYLDNRVSMLIDHIQSVTDQPTTVVVTADHGDNFGSEVDEGAWLHGDSTLAEGVAHVPALIINPPMVPASHDAYVSHLDFGTLLTGIKDGEVPNIYRDAVPAERMGNNVKKEGRDPVVRCVYDGTDKYYWKGDGTEATYELDRSKPSWQRKVSDEVDIAQHEPRFFDGRIEDAVKRDDSDAVSDDVQERLEHLGYR